MSYDTLQLLLDQVHLNTADGARAKRRLIILIFIEFHARRSSGGAKLNYIFLEGVPGYRPLVHLFHMRLSWIDGLTYSPAKLENPAHGM